MDFKSLNRKLSSFLPLDKCYHILAGITLFALGNFHSATLGLTLVFVTGTAKEIYDYIHRDRHTPDPMDALATFAGGLLGFICTIPA